MFLLAAPLVVTPTFAATFANFGSESNLPAITRLVMSWWLPPVLAVVPVALVLAASTVRCSPATCYHGGVVADRRSARPVAGARLMGGSRP